MRVQMSNGQGGGMMDGGWGWGMGLWIGFRAHYLDSRCFGCRFMMKRK